MTWWAWLVIGLVFFVLEALTPGGFYLMFFGVGAGVVGLLDVTGIQLPFVWSGLLFVVVSVIALLLFRKPLLARFQRNIPTAKVDSLVGETATALQDISAGGRGSAELRGASWNVQNVGEAPIPRSACCRVERVDGLTLHVRG